MSDVLSMTRLLQSLATLMGKDTGAPACPPNLSVHKDFQAHCCMKLIAHLWYAHFTAIPKNAAGYQTLIHILQKKTLTISMKHRRRF